jgi:hypothetical protein
MVAVFVTNPTAVGSTAATYVYVTVAPGSKTAIASVRFPVPEWPFVPDHDTPVNPAGSTSLTATLVAVLGPVSETTIV